MPFSHYKSDEPIEIFRFLSDKTQLNLQTLKDLISLGCLYQNGRRCYPKSGDILPKDVVIRFHPNPKRFPLEQLKKIRILNQTSDYVAIWKPAGLPSHETLDNSQENVKRALENQIQTQIWPTSRLDVGTQGILIFALTPEFAKYFNRCLQNHSVNKFYTCLTQSERPLSKGNLIHLMVKSKIAPKVLLPMNADQEKQDLLHCELRVINSSKVTETKDIAALNFDLNTQLPLIQSQLKLITGRTHQIRAQLSQVGHPILGDTLYGSPAQSHYHFDHFALICSQVILEEIGLNIEIDIRNIQW